MQGNAKKTNAPCFMDNYMTFLHHAAKTHRNSDGKPPSALNNLPRGPTSPYPGYGGMASSYPSYGGHHNLMPAHAPPYHGQVASQMATRGGSHAKAAHTDDNLQTRPLDMRTTECSVLDLSVCNRKVDATMPPSNLSAALVCVAQHSESVEVKQEGEPGAMCEPCLTNTGPCTEGHAHCQQVRHWVHICL